MGLIRDVFVAAAAIGLVYYAGTQTKAKYDDANTVKVVRRELSITIRKGNLFLTGEDVEYTKRIHLHPLDELRIMKRNGANITSVSISDGGYNNKLDGVPDEIRVNDWTYKRGEPGTEEMFKKIDETWNNYRKEMNIEEILKQENTRPDPKTVDL